MTASPDALPKDRRGALYGLLAAALFGLSAPVAKRLLGQVSPQLLAGLLYLGAGIGLSLWRKVRPPKEETPLKRQDVPALAGVVIMGGVLGPLLLLIGLNRVSAVTGSLLLNLEGPFTMGLAVLLFREHLGRYGLVAAVLILAGAALLRLQTATAGLRVDAWGTAAIAAACWAWAVDNNLVAAMLMMAAGVAALLRERHSHPHEHEALEHDHLHTHDEHHQHQHDFGAVAGEPHAHPHRHAALVHDHPHVPEVHHRHRH